MFAVSAQRLLGLAVWRTGKWYLRRRARRGPLAVAARLAGLAAFAGLAAAGRRLAD
jgi:hypothetical protein